MFTGIVEERGEVVARTDLGDSVRLTVRGSRVIADVGRGDSVAVNGCCLTVVEHDGDTFFADVMRESLDRTSLAALRAGTPVNLERAVPADGRLGGHLVQGHVDGTARLLSRTLSEHWAVLRFGLPAPLGRYLAPQGSVAVDGVSLTVVDVSDGPSGASDAAGCSFTVSLVPTTLAATTLGALTVGDLVNVEVDVLAKYVERLLAARGGAP